jgi:hypothetical protein
MTGPQPLGTELLLGLTIDELDVLRMHLTSGWYKQGVVYSPAVKCDLWWEVRHILDDCHRAFNVIMNGAQ